MPAISRLRPYEVAGDVFRRLIIEYQRGPGRPVGVLGPLDLCDCDFTNELEFREISFRGLFIARNATFKSGLRFVDCHFEQGLDLENATIEGDLVLENCEIAPISGSDREPSLRLRKAEVSGDVKIGPDVKIDGRLDARLIVVKSDLRFIGATIDYAAATKKARSRKPPGQPKSAAECAAATDKTRSKNGDGEPKPAVDLDRAEISGSCLLDHDPDAEDVKSQFNLFRRKTEIKGRLCMQIAEISANLDINTLVVADDFALSGTTIKGWVQGQGFIISRDFWCLGLTCFQYIRLSNAEIGGACEFGAATIKWQLHLESIEVKKDITFNGSSVGSFVCGVMGTKVSCQMLSGVDSTFSSYVSLPGLTCASNPVVDEEAHGVRFTTCTFENFLAFWGPRIWNGQNFRYVAWTSECHSATIDGCVTVKDCEIRGDLDLTRVIVKSDNLGHGNICLDGSKISGSLRFSSPVGVVADANHDLQKIECAKKSLQDRKKKQTTEIDPQQLAKCRQLSMRGIEARDIDLTGLEVELKGEPGETGHVRASGAIVVGTFRTYAEHRDGERGNEIYHDFARIPRSLDLEGAKIGTLLFTSHTFASTKSPDEQKKAVVVLQHATIGHLQIPRAEDSIGKIIPGPLNISPVKIDHWSFAIGDDNNRSGKEIAYHYLDILDQDLGFHRDIYRSVYNLLKNAGEDKAADCVFIAEQYRAQWDNNQQANNSWRPGDGRYIGNSALGHRVTGSSKFKSGMRDTLYRKLLLYGLDAWPLLAIIGILAGLSFIAATDEQNFELSDQARFILATSAEHPEQWKNYPATGISGHVKGNVLGPAEDDWNLGHALWMVARYHIPIIGIAARSDYEPTDDGPLYFFGYSTLWSDLKANVRKPARANGDLQPKEPESAPRPVTARPQLPGQLPGNGPGEQTPEASQPLIAEAKPNESGPNSSPCETPEPAHPNPQCKALQQDDVIITPEDWFVSMSIANWIMWPILLAFLVRKLMRSE